ncbi:MFS transporter [Actinomadura parmotrematis]|uniref:MFS transporter n=1 Tax=Actinomadura parmotrematis TaxID=2864039 RepID=A0ABS7G375_9ACTN|nr:MFS transporter [Actinomadura parmotrematis]MBW8486805.1 MFS transporter [Actinomadura parmotrematis]
MRRYAALLRRPGLARWSAVRLLTRFPAAAAPIMFVLLSKTRLGDYRTGAWMAAGCVAAECVAAPVLGARLDRRPMLAETRAALAVTAAALIAVAAGVRALPAPALVALAALAGGAISGLIGGLRTLLTRALPAGEVRTGLAWESSLTDLTFAAAPALVTGLALGVDGRLPPLLAAGGALLALPLLPAIPGIRAVPAPAAPDPRGPARPLLAAWPIYLTSAAAMYLSATIEVALSPLLEQHHLDIAWTGVLLSAFAVASIAGGLVYGLRSWPGSHRAQSLALLAAMTALVALAAAGARTGLPLVAVPLVAAGAAQAGLVTARNLSLHHALPARHHSAGNSVMYAASCLGYGSSATVIAVFLTPGRATALVLLSCLLTLGTAAAGAAAERLAPADHPVTTR